MNTRILFVIVALFTGFQPTADAAQTIHCKSWDTFKENVTVDIQFDGQQALMAMNLNGEKETATAKVEPWHNFVPNRCGSYASGWQFAVNAPNVHQLHVVTSATGIGCFEPSSISYDGLAWASIYLKCN